MGSKTFNGSERPKRHRQGVEWGAVKEKSKEGRRVTCNVTVTVTLAVTVTVTATATFAFAVTCDK